MKNKRGITLISLVITILVLLILASIATYSGINVINSSRLTTFTAELKIMQTQVNEMYEKYKNNDTIQLNGITYGGAGNKTILEIGQEPTQEQNNLLNALASDSTSGVKSSDGYKYWDQNLLKDLKIEGVEQDLLINIEKRVVVSYKGLKYQDKMYYTLAQLPSNLYNVDYTNPNEGAPSFDVIKEKLTDGKWRVTITNIQYDGGYVDKWQVRYALDKENDAEEFWNSTEDMSFIVNQDGRYMIQLLNDSIAGDPITKYIYLIGSGEWDGNQNSPKLENNMQAVYWNENKEEITEENNQFNIDNWYDYVAGDNKTDSKDSHWANCETSDGSYWVWIPRYEYRITVTPETSTENLAAGTIEVKFIPTSQTIADEGYKIHPAFTTNLENGGWDKELAGIWVAKYEMSGEDTQGVNKQPGDVAALTNGDKLVSKPGVSSWRSITIGNCYTICYNYDRAKDSHLMKNSEWGAVAYLTHSQYGRNGHEITNNTSDSYYTGGNSGEAYKTNTNQSSTGNVYGIYDLAGGAFEKVAAYIPNSYAKSQSTGNSFTCDEEGNIKTDSTKYATVYPYDSSNDNSESNYNKYKKSGETRYGDAILETSSSGSGSTSWNHDYSDFPYTSRPFFLRGGYYWDGAYGGVFCFTYNGGGAGSYYSFRTVLAF